MDPRRLRLFRCEGPVRRVRFSPDGSTLAATTAAPDHAVYTWQLTTGRRLRRAAQTELVDSLAWRPDS